MYNIFDKVFNKTLIKNNNVEFKFNTKCDIQLINKETNGEIQFINKENNEILISIEVKMEDVLKNINLIKDFNSKNNATQCIKQIHTSVKQNKSKYGILTTYTRTWVFKNENNTFYISPEYTKRDFLNLVYFLINLVCDNF